MRQLANLLSRNKGFIAFMFCMFVFRSAVADWNTVPTGSMQPTIRIGDRILVDRVAYDIRIPFTHVSLRKLADPQRGDIVVLDSTEAGERLVKRVIGTPGDRIALRGNRLIVNGEVAGYTPVTVDGIGDDTTDPAHYAVERSGGNPRVIRLSDYRPSVGANFGPVTVPAGQYLLMGDNRDNSYDSRFLGFAPRAEILGRARYVAFSLDPAHHDLPRNDRFGAALDGQAESQDHHQAVLR
ncbi:signal peptidase I [Dyella sp.]|uniref:signal peptidase I n=1 Tax=Dyella sp. TaxID=1869338 RepID=UPI002ED18F95